MPAHVGFGWYHHRLGVTAREAHTNLMQIWANHLQASAVGEPKEKIRIEPVEVPIPVKTPAPVETPVEVPEKVPS